MKIGENKRRTILIIIITIFSLLLISPGLSIGESNNFDVTFEVENVAGEPLENVRIVFDGIENHTDHQGIAVFENISEGTYEYSLEKHRYSTIENEIEITENTNIEKTMEGTDIFSVESITIENKEDSQGHIKENENLYVEAKIFNEGLDEGTQTVSLYNYDNEEVDNEVLSLDSGEEENIEFVWEASFGYSSTDNITVRTEDDERRKEATIDPQSHFKVEINDLSWADWTEAIEVEVDVHNIGGEENTQEIKLEAIGLENDQIWSLDRKFLNLSGYERESIILDFIPWEDDIEYLDALWVESDDDNDFIFFRDIVELEENHYYMVDNKSLELKGDLINILEDEPIEPTTWNWGIVDYTYEEADVLGHTYLIGDTQENPKVNAPYLLDDDTEAENIIIRSLIIYEKEGMTHFSYYENVLVTVLNALRARPGGPYIVPENTSKELDGTQSSGPIEKYNWGLETEREDIYLTEETSAEPTIHATKVDDDVETNLRLEVTRKDDVPIRDYYYDSAKTPLTILDTSLTAKIQTENITEGENQLLISGSEGLIYNYEWEIVEDNTGEVEIENAESENAIIKPPRTLENDENITVRLSVWNDWREDNVTENILIKTIEPSPPENLRVAGEKSPEELTDLTPEFSSIYKNENPYSEAENVEIVIEEFPGMEEWTYTGPVENLEPRENFHIDFEEIVGPDEEDSLSPNQGYEWSIRFKDRSGWGEWAENSFKTDHFLSLPREEAVSYLTSNVSLNRRARTVENAIDTHRFLAVEILEEVPSPELAELFREIAASPFSPRHVAIALEEMDVYSAASVISEMIANGDYEELEKVFVETDLSEEKLEEIIKILTPSDREALEENLSDEVVDVVPGLDGWPILMILVMVAIGIGVAFLVLLAVSYYLLMRKRKKTWDGIIKKFVSIGAESAAINSNLPPEDIVERARSAIKRLGLAEDVKIAKQDSKIVLKRK